MIMMKTKRTGSGTVSQTIQDELLTPLKTQKKMRIQVTRVDQRALWEKVVGSIDSLPSVIK
jgi:hypothetical protein|tara:strand:- start:802 stop:984 length:183 start_codon:yes stop_codon:yes gene_type:complete